MKKDNERAKVAARKAAALRANLKRRKAASRKPDTVQSTESKPVSGKSSED